MAVTDFLYTLTYQILVFLIVINETCSYEKILLEESRLCKLRPDDPEASILLGKQKDSSKIVTQKTYFAKWTGRFDFKCSFSVTATRNYGIYAVVQLLNFRSNETGRCIDYIQFYVPQNFIRTFIEKKKHEKYLCGKIYAAQTYLSNSDNSGSRLNMHSVAENSFVAPEGHMHVNIYIARQRLSEDEKLEVQIAFTAYKKECKQKFNHIECGPCEWIWEGLKGDKIQNCPYKSCADENSCKDLESPFEVLDVISNETGTKVTVVVISMIMLTFFLFAICLCACRKSQRCCWQSPQNNVIRVEMNRNPPAAATEEFLANFQELPTDAIQPSAPVVDETKDVPPSYESLFPSK